ncbi:T/G mismatch-specific endonuclease [Micromonospora sediminimaris]|uniref:T/G mismatch-specific endonuclease n=2 Tax=Micromonospora sediminimaris TaxID=547162 RepID=A0A9W5XKG2_9ACTN|nr:hypothetical protein Vse01_35940 [Micromonospora sediminimaris]SFD29982.1 T/G mismatch-specific endonuclease [Micromonospora sediminimaris]
MIVQICTDAEAGHAHDTGSSFTHRPVRRAVGARTGHHRLPQAILLALHTRTEPTNLRDRGGAEQKGGHLILKALRAWEPPPPGDAGWGNLSAMMRRPTALNAVVSAQMSRMPRSRTKPEMSVRRELHRRGLRFRVNHPGLPGRPDIAFTRARLAVFVDGCFWHLCPEHAVLPKNNATWWREKLQRNVQRDREKDEALAALGWQVLHVWEHEDPVAVADIVEQLWRARRRSGTTAWPVK